jgi:hypothetical protein
MSLPAALLAVLPQVLGRDARAATRGAAALTAARQGRQRRDAAATGEEQLGRCSAWRLYLSWRCTFVSNSNSN